MFRKFFDYAYRHNLNPDKYPAGRVPVEFSDFKANLLELMAGFFGTDGILYRLFVFFFDNPILVFLLGFGFALGAFNLIRYSIKISRM